MPIRTYPGGTVHHSADRLGDSLEGLERNLAEEIEKPSSPKHEPSRSGILLPHLHGLMPLQAALRAEIQPMIPAVGSPSDSRQALQIYDLPGEWESRSEAQ